jgi:hypothetical protein
VCTVPRVVIPLQNVDTVIRNGLFAHLAVFSSRIKGTTHIAVVPVLTCTRCVTHLFLSSSFLRCLVLIRIRRIRMDDTGGEILSRCVDPQNDTQQIWTRLYNIPSSTTPKSKRSLLFRFSIEILVCIYNIFHVCYMYLQFYHLDLITLITAEDYKLRSFFFMLFSPIFRYFLSYCLVLKHAESVSMS